MAEAARAAGISQTLGVEDIEPFGTPPSIWLPRINRSNFEPPHGYQYSVLAAESVNLSGMSSLCCWFRPRLSVPSSYQRGPKVRFCMRPKTHLPQCTRILNPANF
ncbi:uncharacterized protein BCR38DRAFT_88212 [Pseudomassariella vexata]|uniref:Uncharacterized protein n=1 Tax=Pseudomassariella vexata TaxID=1141098 RepID=A0A1Y2EDB6_9PEZI|nr:uncharacterized protein BCR38DRAFT_88212 [Pseudomassariella vexata]ORY69569.1 hypothetical protein BCR38DRAFT_88212 [Pseudomassariella vexata]